MGEAAKETARIAESLPEEKARALLEYARYLAFHADEEAWERKLADPKYTSKLEAMASEALADYRAGKTKPIDPKKL